MSSLLGTGTSARSLEPLTRQIGLEIFEHVHAHAPVPLTPSWFGQKGMSLLSAREALRVQAFRFVDALPTMQSSAQIAGHLQEYFAPLSAAADAPDGFDAGPSPRPPDWLTMLAARWMDFRDIAGLRARLTARGAWLAARAMANRFLAGSNVQQAEQAIRRLRKRRLAFTIDLLGESALSRAEAEAVAATYLQLIDELPARAQRWPEQLEIDRADGEPIPRVNVSVKLTALHPGFDPIAPQRAKAIAKERLRPLLRRAMAQGVHIHVDMEHYAIKDLTLEMCREVFCEPEFRAYPHFGVVLQAYLRDGLRDAAEMIAWSRRRAAPFWIRLVKGAYWDSETVWARQSGWPCPVWLDKRESDATYERMTHALLSNWRHTPLALASHNVRSLAHAIALRRALSAPAAAFEIQMLYGMSAPLDQAIVEQGERCRIYSPYGDLLPGMAYLIRRLLENTANESFLRQAGSGELSPEQLLQDPRESLSRHNTGKASQERALSISELTTFQNHPHADFSRTAQRCAMTDALARVREAFGAELMPVIDGAALRCAGRLEWRNPSRPAEIVARVHLAAGDQVDHAVRSARKGLALWKAIGTQARVPVLFEAARIMQERRFELAAWLALASGKTWREADAEVCEAIDYVRYYALQAPALAGREVRESPGETNEQRWEPRGVVSVIGTWCFPLSLMAGAAAAALVTGNTVVLKPARAGSVVAARLHQILLEAGVPPAAAAFLPGAGPEVGEALVRHPSVALVAFTGSGDVGLQVNRIAAESSAAQRLPKKVLLELGGKNATLVDCDADVDEAIKGVLHSAFAYAGQKCTSASRCVVLDGIYERFVTRLCDAAHSISVGPADDPATFVPPLIDAAQLAAVEEFIAVGKREARCALQTDVSELRAAPGGYFVGPTIFDNVPQDAVIARKEVLGPVLSILRARDMAHAIALFNDTEYALTGGIFSRSPANIDRARRECESGNFFVNRKVSGARVELQPFGGYKLSGLGAKNGGPDYLPQFCNARTITENTLRRGFAPSERVAEVIA